MSRTFAILSGNTDAARTAAKAAGCTHAIINVNWNDWQPSATGTTDAATAATLVANVNHALSIGLQPIISINLHYPASWVLSAVEPFKDQSANQYLDTNTTFGKAVRNWMWTTTGRTYVADFISRVGSTLGSLASQIVGARLGGGWYGELHYPQAVSGGPTYAWQGFGTSMQSGTGLASDLTVCPLPGYVPYTGTDAQDCQWLNWYINGIVTWALWLIQQHKNAGFTQNLYVLCPGYGVRLNMLRSSNGYKQAAALGEDPVRVIGAIMNDPAVWPYNTWLNTDDGFPGGTVDSDKSAWKSLWEKSYVRGKHYNLWGENTGGESNSGMDGIFTDALGGASYAGSIATPASGYYYSGLAWLSYDSLNAGGSDATLAHYNTSIAAALNTSGGYGVGGYGTGGYGV